MNELVFPWTLEGEAFTSEQAAARQGKHCEGFRNLRGEILTNIVIKDKQLNLPIFKIKESKQKKFDLVIYNKCN